MIIIPNTDHSCIVLQPVIDPSATPTVTPTATNTNTPTQTPTVSPTKTKTPTTTKTRTATPTQTSSETPTQTATPTKTQTVTPTPSVTPEPTPTSTLTKTQTPTNTKTSSQTPTTTQTRTSTYTPTQTPTTTSTLTSTPTPTVSLSQTISSTPTKTQTPTKTPAPTQTPTPTIQCFGKCCLGSTSIYWDGTAAGYGETIGALPASTEVITIPDSVPLPVVVNISGGVDDYVMVNGELTFPNSPPGSASYSYTFIYNTRTFTITCYNAFVAQTGYDLTVCFAPLGYFEAFDGSNRRFRKLKLNKADTCSQANLTDGSYILFKNIIGEIFVDQSTGWYANTGWPKGAQVEMIPQAIPPAIDNGFPGNSATFRSLSYEPFPDGCGNELGNRIYIELFDEVI